MDTLHALTQCPVDHWPVGPRIGPMNKAENHFCYASRHENGLKGTRRGEDQIQAFANSGTETPVLATRRCIYLGMLGVLILSEDLKMISVR